MKKIISYQKREIISTWSHIQRKVSLGALIALIYSSMAGFQEATLNGHVQYIEIQWVHYKWNWKLKFYPRRRIDTVVSFLPLLFLCCWVQVELELRFQSRYHAGIPSQSEKKLIVIKELDMHPRRSFRFVANFRSSRENVSCESQSDANFGPTVVNPCRD